MWSSWMWLQTELNEKKSCYQLIITISISEKSNTPTNTNTNTNTQPIVRITLSDNNCTERFVKNKAASAPIIFEEFVMVMIR